MYRQKSDGTYELIGTPGTGYAAYIYSDRELQPGTKIVLSKSMTLVVEDLWNPCTGLTPSPDGELWRGLFD